MATHICVLKHLSAYRRHELKNASDGHRWISIHLNGLQRWFSRSSSSSDFPPFNGHDHRRRNHGPGPRREPWRPRYPPRADQENAQNHERKPVNSRSAQRIRLLDELDNVLSKRSHRQKKAPRKESSATVNINPRPTRPPISFQRGNEMRNFPGLSSDSNHQTSDHENVVSSPDNDSPRASTTVSNAASAPLSQVLPVSSDNVALDDIFGIPSRPSADSPSQENDEQSHYKEYMEILDRYVATSVKLKAIKDDKLAPLLAYLKQQDPVIPTEYPQFGSTIASCGALSSSQMLVNTEDCEPHNIELSEQVNKQKEAFKEKMGFDPKQMSIVAGLLNFMGGQCARYAKIGPLKLTWQKVLESGFVDKNILHPLIHMAATVSIEKKRSSGSGTTLSILDVLDGVDVSKGEQTEAKEEKTSSEGDVEDDDDVSKILDEMATFHDLLYEPTEQTVHVRVRLLVSRGEGKAAEKLLRESKTTLRLRVFTPVLSLLLQQKDFKSAFSLYQRMHAIDSVILDADSYITLISGLAEHGCFNNDAPAVPGAAEVGYSASGPSLFDELVGEMAEEFSEITITSARRLYNSLAKGLSDNSSLKPVGTLESLAINNTHALDDSSAIAGRVIIDSQTGVCPRTGVKLHLKHLTDGQKESLKKGCKTLALERQESWSYKATTMADENLDSFLDWIDSRHGEPFTAIVDGANVGYYMQNYDGGQFNYHQIDFVVRSLEMRGENPLVILPFKYTRDVFTGSTNNRRQFLTDEDHHILQNLRDGGKLFVVNSGLLDDFYWILASVAKQTTSSGGRDLTVPFDDSSRWPGMRPVLITNDQVRDHKLGMLEPMPFKRWNSNVIVNYNFAPYAGTQRMGRGIGFSPIAFYSREIQCNRNENATGASVWHFPLCDSTDEWFCVRLPQRADSN